MNKDLVDGSDLNRNVGNFTFGTKSPQQNTKNIEYFHNHITYHFFREFAQGI